MKEKIKEKLTLEKEALLKQLETYKKDDPYAGGRRNDDFDYDDQITDSETHDRLTATRAELLQRLKEIEDTLERIREGKFGICQSCGEKISEERLKANPTASFCLRCEEKLNKNLQQ